MSPVDSRRDLDRATRTPDDGRPPVEEWAAQLRGPSRRPRGRVAAALRAFQWSMIDRWAYWSDNRRYEATRRRETRALRRGKPVAPARPINHLALRVGVVAALLLVATAASALVLAGGDGDAASADRRASVQQQPAAGPGNPQAVAVSAEDRAKAAEEARARRAEALRERRARALRERRARARRLRAERAASARRKRAARRNASAPKAAAPAPATQEPAAAAPPPPAPRPSPAPARPKPKPKGGGSFDISG